MHSAKNLASIIDHTLLKPEARQVDFEQHCQEAVTHSFFSVCVPPSQVSLCAKILKNSNVKVCTVIGFPLGYGTSPAKNFEAKLALDNGAHEIDMVINIGALKDGFDSHIIEEISGIVRLASGRMVKVIMETCLLNLAEKIRATQIAIKSGAHFVKTSTGFGPSGATLEDVKLLVEHAKGQIQVKASGGIRDYPTALQMFRAGASRLGTSQSVSIVTDSKTHLQNSY